MSDHALNRRPGELGVVVSIPVIGSARAELGKVIALAAGDSGSPQFVGASLFQSFIDGDRDIGLVPVVS